MSKGLIVLAAEIQGHALVNLGLLEFRVYGQGQVKIGNAFPVAA